LSEHIKQATVKELAARPDEQAKESLLATRWRDQPQLVQPALHGAAKLGGEDVRDALCETIGFSSHPEIRQTAIELLGDYPDDKTRETLASVAKDDEDETVRETATQVLSALSEE